jgi:nitrate reductase gamma subunit
MTAFHAVIYGSTLVFMAAVIGRIIRIAKMPIHLRWELYPVPHERGRAAYGGSVLEEVDWWTKPREMDRITELGVTVREIIFLKGVWEHNRPLWFGSWTLHFGLYLLISDLALLMLNGFLKAIGVNAPWLAFFPIFNIGLTWAGSVFGLIGSVIMYKIRLTNPKLKPFNNASHYFNLILLGTIYLTGLIWVATDPQYAIRLYEFFAGLFTLSILPHLPLIGYWHIGLVLFFLIYFPFTHMTHAFVKYFTYHDIRWEDTPNLPGGKLQAKIDEMENQTITWAAPHILADGKKNWVDVVADPGEGKKS